MPNTDVTHSRPGVYTYTRKLRGTLGTEAGYVTTQGSWTYTRFRSSVNYALYRMWKQKKAKVSLPMNPFTFRETTSNGWAGYYVDESYDYPPHSVNGFYDRQSGTFPDGYFNVASLTPDLPLSITDAVDRQARNKVLLELKDQKINLAQLYAERKQVEKMLLNFMVRTTKSITALRKGDFKGAADALGVKVRKRAQRRYNKAVREAPGKTGVQRQKEATASGWLELQYGWLPLASDVYGACELLAERNAEVIKEKVIGKRTHTTMKNGLSRFVNVGTINYTWEYSIKYTVKYTIHYSTSAPALKLISEVGITNPALLAWELMPWSFVIDWALPIGNWLSTFDATLGLVFGQGCKTVYYKSSGKINKRQYERVDGSILRHINQNYNRERVDIRRTVLTDFPLPGLPVMKNPISAMHIANAFALATQLMKK